MQYAKAKLARFYGWSPKEIGAIPISDFFAYHSAIDKLEAHEMTNAIRVGVFPNMKRGSQERLSKELSKLAYRGIEGDSSPKTNKEIALELARKLSNG